MLLIWALTHLPPGVAPAGPDTLAGQLAAGVSPVFEPLGIDPLMSIALLFGFVAKEIVLGGMAVVLGAGTDQLASAVAARLDWRSAMSFMLFTLIYTPCLSAIATLHNEAKSLRYTALAVAWPLGLAWFASFAFYQGARSLGFLDRVGDAIVGGREPASAAAVRHQERLLPTSVESGLSSATRRNPCSAPWTFPYPNWRSSRRRAAWQAPASASWPQAT